MAVKQDWSCTQGFESYDWSQMRMGVCSAMAYDWIRNTAKGRNYHDVIRDGTPQTVISMQRALRWAFEKRVHEKSNGRKEMWDDLRQLARHDNLRVDDFRNLYQLPMSALSPATLRSVLRCVNSSFVYMRVSGSRVAHVFCVKIDRPPFLFFDPNKGQTSSDSLEELIPSIIMELDTTYEVLNKEVLAVGFRPMV